LKRYKDHKKRQKWEPIYRELLAQAERLAAPAAIYDEFLLAEVTDLTAWLSADTAAVVLALCTLGQPIEAYFKELSQDDLLAAVIFEEIILAWITAFTRQIHAAIRNQGRTRGLKAGPAYRPGVGRWPLTTQRTVFACLPAYQIGISLNEQLWMTPSKSTSLIIPLIPDQ
jgi:cobalamin-dependent methionine synthase I